MSSLGATGRLALTLGPGLRYNRFRILHMQARSTGEAELLETQRRRREARDADRPTPRRARRRRQSTPWLQRNALSVAALSILVALLGLGFGLVQMLTRPEPAPATLALSTIETPTASANTLNAASVGPSVQMLVPPPAVTSPSEPVRQIQSNVKVLQPNYTIAAGDTLLRIAARFGTTVDRIQAFNNLADPRALRIGTPLVIPPPL